MHVLIEIAGWVGTILILSSYILVSAGRLNGRSVSYQIMNLVGSAGFIINSGVNGAYPSAALNVIWFAVSVAALVRNCTTVEHIKP